MAAQIDFIELGLLIIGPSGSNNCAAIRITLIHKYISLVNLIFENGCFWNILGISTYRASILSLVLFYLLIILGSIYY